MRILLTNNTLADRAGSELYLKDVALGLLARGHHPIAFSTILGRVAEELRRATVPVIDDLNDLGDAPDVIHGQHHIETAMAALRFPHVPVLSFCHGWLPWQEAPAKFPNVRRYVAVDMTCRDRLRHEHGISETDIELLLNFVDLRRFKAGPPVPKVPKRALVFGNGPTPDLLSPVREACRRHGIELDVVGSGVGAVHGAPESLLLSYDVVFAKARAALEAMAVGRAVILFDAVGAGPLVRSANFDRLRALNFGIRSLSESPSVEHFERELASYDAGDVAVVHNRVRDEASLDATLDRLIALYTSLVAGPPVATDPEAVGRAASAYIGTIAPRTKRSESAEHGMRVLEQRVLTANHERNLSAAEVIRARSEAQASSGSLAEAQARALSAINDAALLQARLAVLESELRERDATIEHHQATIRQRDQTIDEINQSPAMRLRHGIITMPIAGAVVRRLGQAILTQRS